GRGGQGERITLVEARRRVARIASFVARPEEADGLRRDRAVLRLQVYRLRRGLSVRLLPRRRADALHRSGPVHRLRRLPGGMPRGGDLPRGRWSFRVAGGRRAQRGNVAEVPVDRGTPGTAARLP